MAKILQSLSLRQLQKKHPCGAFFVTDGVVGFEP